MTEKERNQLAVLLVLRSAEIRRRIAGAEFLKDDARFKQVMDDTREISNVLRRMQEDYDWEHRGFADGLRAAVEVLR